MKLNPHSRNRLLRTFVTWHVPKEFANPMYNYLVHGHYPGGCFTAVLANDFYNAIRRSHPANTIEAFKALAGWINDVMPSTAHGSYKAIEEWITMEDDERRTILVEKGLILTAEDEVLSVLAGEPTHEPILY